ncbi:XRE family transcriptional regulator [Metapseudomonas otitidis]|uniref:XRE family transcriptional regulator n=1 Tax=Metapseudomonas otitidis TaxID=319939 RepID=UPI002448C14E|nr:S24 family peptidase [Pseudomonas otitidis]MDG9785241.1 helix-turn-helix domain-containing protein [Pseudomonas otitidis]MDH0335155.1 helix-turn-helix domain-containing protein [Pseudomonas otitidis]
MQKPTIHTILRALMKQRGVTQTELKKATGVDQSTISRILSKKIESPTDEQVAPLAAYFKVSTDQLRGRAPIDVEALPQMAQVLELPLIRPIPQPDAVMDGPVDVWDDTTPLPDDEVLVPFLKEVELAAGSGRLGIEVSTSRKLRFGKYTLKNQGVDPANARCVTITGNSMEPVLKNGATVGVDVGNTRVVDGDMYAINHGGQLRVKQAYRLPGGGIRLRSFNRDEHPDEEYTQEEMERYEIVVLGRVFWGAMFF